MVIFLYLPPVGRPPVAGGARTTKKGSKYYLRVIHFSFFEQASSRLMWHRPEKLCSWFIASSCLFQLLLFLNPNDVVVLFQPAAYELFV